MTAQPNPRFTFWSILAAVLGILVLVFVLAYTSGSQGIIQFKGFGGTIPAGVVVSLALVIGIVTLMVFRKRPH